MLPMEQPNESEKMAERIWTETGAAMAREAGADSLERRVRAPRASVEYMTLQALNQLLVVTWDGNLMSKDARDRLVKCGLAQRHQGYNWITTKGIQYLVDLGALVP